MSKIKDYKEFISIFYTKFKDRHYIFDEKTYINMHTPMRVFCPKHGEFWKEPRKILKYECIKCSYEKRGLKNTLTTKDFIKKAKEIHGDKYDYSKTEYHNSKEKVCIICPKHGEFMQIPNDHLSGKGCYYCNTSHLENNIKNILNKNNIKFIYQYKPSWLGKQSLDFYLPDYNIAIECQGKQHFGLGGWSKNFDFKKLLTLDEQKFFLSINNNITLIYVTNENLLTYSNISKIYTNNIYSLKNFLKCILKNK